MNASEVTEIQQAGIDGVNGFRQVVSEVGSTRIAKRRDLFDWDALISCASPTCWPVVKWSVQRDDTSVLLELAVTATLDSKNVSILKKTRSRWLALIWAVSRIESRSFARCPSNTACAGFGRVFKYACSD